MRRLLRLATAISLTLLTLALISSGPALADTTFAPPAGVCLNPLDGCLKLQTVPPLQGIRFELTNASGLVTADRTDRSGAAYLTGWSPDEIADLSLKNPHIERDGYVADFDRWNDVDNPHPTREIEFPGGYLESLEVGFFTSVWLTRTFVDDATPPNTIDANHIRSLEIRRGDTTVINPFTDTTDCPGGATNEETATGRCLFLASKLLNNSEGLQPAPVTYSVQTVIYDGQNVVYGGFNTFTCGWPFDANDCLPNGNWQIGTLFYDVSVSVRDRLIGSPTGSSLDLIYPNGKVDTYTLQEGRVDLNELPRGDYTVVVHGAGLSLKAPMNVSKDTDADLVFLSYVDLLIAFIAVALFIGGFLWVGRRRFAREEGGSTRPAYLDDVYDELAEEEARRYGSVTELHPRWRRPDREVEREVEPGVEVEPSPPEPVRAPEPTDAPERFGERAATLERELELRSRKGTPDRITPPNPSTAAAGAADDVGTNDRRHRPMSPQEQAAFHVPTEAEVEAENAARESTLPNLVEHRIVELQAVAKAKTEVSKRARFRRGRPAVPQPAEWDSGFGSDATVRSATVGSPTIGSATIPPRGDAGDDTAAPTQEPQGDPADAAPVAEAAANDVAEESTTDVEPNGAATESRAPEDAHEEEQAVDRAASRPPRAKRAAAGRKAQTARQRRSRGSGRRKPRTAAKRKPSPETTVEASAPPTRTDTQTNPEPTEAASPLLEPGEQPAGEEGAGSLAARGHSPRPRPRKAPVSLPEGPAGEPDASEELAGRNGDSTAAPDPVQEAGLRPIAGGNGSKPPTSPARRRRPPSHEPEPSVATEE